VKRTDRQKRVVWLYDEDHLNHPFIRLAAESLVDAGYSVSVLDRAVKPGVTRYRHIALGLENRWLIRLVNRIKRLSAPSTSMTGPNSVPLSSNASDLSVSSPSNGFWGAISGLYGQMLNAFFLTSVLLQTIVRRPSIIIASLPNVAAMGWLAAGLWRSRLVYYPFELYGEQYTVVPPLWKRLELFLLSRGIDALITQNEERARIYVEERKAHVAPVIVHNYKARRRVPRSGKLRDLLKLPAECRIVLYEGQLQVGRCLTHLIRSASWLPDDTRLVFMGEKFPWWEQKAEPLLKASKGAGKILVAPRVLHTELLDYVTDADVGVIIYDDTVRNNYYCEPGKLSDYLAAGVPVVVPDFPTIAPVVHRYGIGAAFKSPEPEEIARAIIQVLSVQRRVWQSALERAREELVWETQLPDFLTAVAGK